jgi:hypothetical protein
MLSRAVCLVVFLAFTFAHFFPAHAQVLPSEKADDLHAPSSVSAKATGLHYPRIEPAYAWQLPPWSASSDAVVNAPLNGPGVWAGDINGDGRIDLLHVRQVLDDREESGEIALKTFVYFGGVVSTEPDQIVHAHLEPVGDLDGDGYADAMERNAFSIGPVFWRGSPEGYIATGVEAGGFLANVAGLPSKGVDLDGDGHLDFLLSTRYWTSQMFYVASGADAMEDVAIQTVYWADAFRLSSITMTDGGDGQPFLVAAGRNWEDPAPSLRIFTLDRQGEIDVLQTISLGGYNLPELSAVQIYLIDVTGDGQMEIVLERFPFWWQEGSDVPLLVFQRDPDAESFRYLDVATPLFDRHLRPIGDLNGDGRHDYLRVDELTGTAHVVFGPPSLSDPLVLGPRIGADGQRIMLPAEIPSGTFGDVTGNGHHDVVVGFDEPQPIGSGGAFGQIVVEGQGNASVMQTERRFIDTDYFGPEITFTTNVGDLDGDGIDDLALTDLGGRWPAVHFHLSGSGVDDDPDVVVTRAGWRPAAVAGGDFTGNGKVDVAILWREFGLTVNTQVAVYLDGDLNAQPNVINADHVGGQTIHNVVNAGDLNGDGVDDLLLTGVLTASVFFGGALRSAPDLQWDLSRPIRAAAAIGDVNADGIDDLAISIGTHVLVYFGKVGLTAADIAQPDLELANSMWPGTGSFGPFGLTAGDFNGDGFRDIAVLATIENNQMPSELVRPLHIFLGGPDINEEVDALARLPEDPSIYLWQSDFRCSELVTLPGVGGDRDGLLLGSCHTANAYVYVATETEPSIRAVLEAPGWGSIGTNNAVSYGSPLTSAAGDFTGDGKVDIVLPRTRDPNRPGSSTFLFSIEEIDPGSQPVRAQFVHASADPSLETVSLSVDGASVMQGLRFREATSDVVVPRGAPFTVSVSAEALDQPVLVDVPALENGKYWLVLTGVADPETLAPNPGGHDTALRFEVVRRAAPEGDIVHVVQGVTDEEWIQAGMVGSSMPVLLFESRYGGPIQSVGLTGVPNPVELYLTPDPVEARAFRFDLQAMGPEVLLVTTGFIEPAQNHGGPILDLIAVKPGDPAIAVPSFAVSTEGADELPAHVALHAGYPNPFNPSTTLAFDLPGSADVRLHVFDMLGRRVSTLIDEHRPAGRHAVTFDAHGLASGTYLVILDADGARKTQTVVMMK